MSKKESFKSWTSLLNIIDVRQMGRLFFEQIFVRQFLRQKIFWLMGCWATEIWGNWRFLSKIFFYASLKYFYLISDQNQFIWVSEFILGSKSSKNTKQKSEIQIKTNAKPIFKIWISSLKAPFPTSPRFLLDPYCESVLLYWYLVVFHYVTRNFFWLLFWDFPNTS